MDFKNLSLIELSSLLSSGKSTTKEIYTYFLDRVHTYNAELNAFNTLPPAEYSAQE
jgi:Asp-tRNA(Asn)/Glu-tRNA(Gln) amidotransferase A subunit family amidase